MRRNFPSLSQICFCFCLLFVLSKPNLTLQGNNTAPPEMDSKPEMTMTVKPETEVKLKSEQEKALQKLQLARKMAEEVQKTKRRVQELLSQHKKLSLLHKQVREQTSNLSMSGPAALAAKVPQLKFRKHEKRRPSGGSKKHEKRRSSRGSSSSEEDEKRNAGNRPRPKKHKHRHHGKNKNKNKNKDKKIRPGSKKGLSKKGKGLKKHRSLLYWPNIYYGMYGGYKDHQTGGWEKSAEKEPEADLCLTPQCVWLAGQLLDRMDENVDPCDDFERFACGKYLRREQDKDYDQDVDAEMEAQLRQALEGKWHESEYPSHVNQAKKLFDQCNNKEKVDSDGFKPLLDILELFGGLPMLKGECDQNCQDFEWPEANILARKLGFITTIFPNVEPLQVRNPVEFEPSLGCGMWQPIDWELQLPKFISLGVDNRTAARALSEVFQLSMKIRHLGEEFSEGEGVFLNFSQLTRVCPSDSKLNNTSQWHSFVNQMILVPGSRLAENSQIHVGSVECLQHFCNLMANSSKEVQMNYFLSHIVFAFFQRMKNDIPRWNLCLGQIHKAMPEALEYIYVHKFFDHKRKELAIHIGEKVRDAMELTLRKSWLQPKTYTHVKEKLARLILNLGYPNNYLDFSAKKNRAQHTKIYQNLKLESENFFLNIHRALKCRFDGRFLDSLSMKDREDISHFEGLLEDGAHYIHHTNAIFLTVRHLENKYFSPHLPNYVNYGVMGTTLGHEMVHAFDANGRKYDKEGNHTGNLWSEKSMAHYQERLVCFVKQYDQYFYDDLANITVDGQRCVNENVADSVGFLAGYHAYVADSALHGQDPLLPGLPHFTARQLFWLVLANASCRRSSQRDRLYQLRMNRHAPQRFRIQGSLSNAKEFARDYQCPRNSAMNPETKCKMW